VSTGAQLKQEGMTAVMGLAPDDWRAAYRSWVGPFLAHHAEFTSDEVRTWMLAVGMVEPPHYNAWGAMFNACFVRRGRVKPTGQMRQAQRPVCHAHMYRVWEAA